MSWDETFSDAYDTWTADMSANSPFYDVAGLQLDALHGGFAGEPLTDDSTYVFVVRRSP